MTRTTGWRRRREGRRRPRGDRHGSADGTHSRPAASRRLVLVVKSSVGGWVGGVFFFFFWADTPRRAGEKRNNTTTCLFTRPGWRSAEIYARSAKTRERRSAVAGVREWTLEWGEGAELDAH
jgi:hypothetical protein